MKRVECLEAIYDELAGCAVVTIMGAVAVELYSLGHRPNFFYLEHAMGLASSMGLGIALSQPERKVVVLDGDGSVLMNLGGLTTLARYAPGNLTHIVFDNQSLLSVGGFPTATATGSGVTNPSGSWSGTASRRGGSPSTDWSVRQSITRSPLATSCERLSSSRATAATCSSSPRWQP